MWPDLEPAATEVAPDGAADSALVVGISDYLLAPDVPGADRNARDWYAYLTDVRGVPVAHTFLLLDAEANDARIRARAEEAATLTGEGGRVWFVFVGHGAPGPDGRALLVGADATLDAETLRARSIDRDQLLAVLAAGGKPVTAIVDACFSGLGADGAPLVPGLQPMVPSWVGPQLPAGVTLATAAAADQFAGPLPDADRPAFSYLVLGAAQGWGDRDADRHVTLAEAVDYATVTLVSRVTSRRQTPSLLGPGELVLGAGREASPLAPRTGGPARAPRSTQGRRPLPGLLVTGGLAIGTGVFAAASGAARADMNWAGSPADLNGDWARSRAYGVATYVTGALTLGALGVTVLH